MSRREELQEKKQRLRNQVKYGGTGADIIVVQPDGTETTLSPGTPEYTNFFKPGGEASNTDFIPYGEDKPVVKPKEISNSKATNVVVVNEIPSKVDYQKGTTAYASKKVDGKALMNQLKRDAETSELSAILSDAAESKALGLSRVAQVENTPTPPEPTKTTIDAYKQLIELNPQDEKSQKNIQEIKEKFSNLPTADGTPLGAVKPKALSELSEKAQKKAIQFKDALENIKIPDSLTTGKLIIQADPFKDTTLDTMKAKIENTFKELKSPLAAGNSAMDISASIKGASEALSTQMGGMVGNMTGQLTEKLMESINGGLLSEQARIQSLFPDGPAGVLEATKAVEIFQNPFLKNKKGGPGMVEGLLDSIGCEPSQITESLPSMFNDLLSSAMGNMVNTPSCATEQIIGAATNKIVNMIDATIKPKLSEIESALSGVSDFKIDVKEMLFKDLDMTGKMPELNVCGTKPPQTDATNKFMLGMGPKLPSSIANVESSFNKILGGASIKNTVSSLTGNISGLSNQVSGLSDQITSISDSVSGIAGEFSNLPGQIVNQATSSFMEGYQSGLGDLAKGLTNKDAFEKEYGSWNIFGGASTGGTSLDNCNTGPVESSGPPKVEAFGGGGSGLKAEVILGNFVNRLNPDDIFAPAERTASIVGVRIINSGKGYSSPPIVTFDDDIGQGYGAYGKATIDQNPNSPTYGQVTSIYMTSTGENYPASEEEDPIFIGGVVIDDPGVGYKDTDTLEDFELTVVDGQIVNVNVVNHKIYDDLPELNINTTTGFGAKLRILLTLIPPAQGEVIQVIDCIGKV